MSPPASAPPQRTTPANTKHIMNAHSKADDPATWGFVQHDSLRYEQAP
jgi:hypothetical protein